MNQKNIPQNQAFMLFFAVTFFISVLAGCILLGPRLLNMDGDLGRHLTVGGFILDSGKIPTVDIFSHTMAGSSFTPHEWLSEVVFTLAYRFIGLTGVVLFTAMLLALVWYRLSYVALSESKSFFVSLILIIIGIAASSIHWLSRPHIFTYIFLLIWIAIYHRRINFGLKYLMLFVTMVLWVNSHGAFITGIVYVFIDIGGKIIKKMIDKDTNLLYQSLVAPGLTLVVSLAAIFVNPVGYHILGTVFSFLGNQYLTSHTMEYQAPNLLTMAFIPFYLFLIVSAVIINRSRKNISPTDILQLVLWSIFGLMSARNIPLAVLVGLPILSRNTGYQMQKTNNINMNSGKELIPVINRSFGIGVILLPVAISLITICIYWISPTLGSRNVFLFEKFPVKAVDYLESHPVEGNMFNEFTWGGYLLYRLWPEQRVFIDGQTDFYGEKLTKDYASIYYTEPGYEDLLQKYNVDWVIVRRTAKIAVELDQESNYWTKEYSDEVSVIYTRK